MKKSKLKEFSQYAESFKAFKKRHKLTEQQMVNIMTQYANTVDEQGASFFASKYGFSEYVFYQIRDYTIVFMLVDASICIQIRDKSYRNQGAKNSTGNYSASANHYDELIALRKDYLKSFSNEIILEIADDYANSIALYDIAKKHKISTHTVRRLLAIALANHLVDYETYSKISFRSMVYCNQLRGFNGYTAKDLWNYSHWE